MLMQIKLPLEPFNSLVRKGAIEATMQRLLAATKPEAAYFTAQEGHRGGVLIVEMPAASDIPKLAEPWFLILNAEVTFQPVMTPEDLGKAQLNTFGAHWA